jgi:hypothetical protein
MPDSDDYATELRDEGMRIVQRDSRVTEVFRWCAIVLAGVTTSAAIWGVSTLVQVKEQMAILVSRPEPVSKAQYDSDQARDDAWKKGAEARLRDIEIARANALQRRP